MDSAHRRTKVRTRRTKKDDELERLSLRLPAGLREKIREKADQLGETESLVVRDALRSYFGRESIKKPSKE